MLDHDGRYYAESVGELSRVAPGSDRTWAWAVGYRHVACGARSVVRPAGAQPWGGVSTIQGQWAGLLAGFEEPPCTTLIFIRSSETEHGPPANVGCSRRA